MEFGVGPKRPETAEAQPDTQERMNAKRIFEDLFPSE
jgi:hypothetical protein